MTATATFVYDTAHSLDVQNTFPAGFCYTSERNSDLLTSIDESNVGEPEGISPSPQRVKNLSREKITQRDVANDVTAVICMVALSAAAVAFLGLLTTNFYGLMVSTSPADVLRGIAGMP